MKIFVKFNLGTNEFPETPLTEGEHTVTAELGELLVSRGYAESLETVKAVAVSPAITGVSEDETAPTAGDNASDAIDKVARMRSIEKLETIVETEPRSTVVEAAKKRLEELK